MLCNALWCITNQHEVINDRASRAKDVKPIPYWFEQFQGYNEVKRKKVKENPISSSTLKSHADALFSICQRPIMILSKEWKALRNDIESLAACLASYTKFLDETNKQMKENHSSSLPARSIDGTSIEYRSCTKHVEPQYSLLDDIMQGTTDPVFFDEIKQLQALFTNNTQRFRFLKNMHLTVPIDLYRYCPGGGHVTTCILQKVAENRTQSQLLSSGAAVGT